MGSLMHSKTNPVEASADVAVIVPVHNRATIVLDALRSVARQTLPPRQLIVVDDGSTDGTSASVSGWMSATSLPFSTRLLRQCNQGVSTARNAGFAVAAGHAAVAFLDSDDVWPRDFLQRTFPLLQSTPSAVAVSCDRAYTGVDGQVMRRDDLTSIAKHATRWIFLKDGGIASCSLFRSAPVQQLGGFDATLRTGQDSDLFLRLSLLGPWLHAVGAAVIFQHGKVHRCGEQDHLAASFPDCHRRWALIHERFVDQHGGRTALRPADCARGMSRRWYCAGKQLMEIGRCREARTCFQRAIAWRCWSHKSWLRLLRTCWSSGRAA